MEAPSGPERCSSPDWGVCLCVCECKSEKELEFSFQCACVRLHVICKCVRWWVSMSRRQKAPCELMTHLSAFSRVCLGRMLFFRRCLSETVESGLRQVGRHSTALSKQPAGWSASTQQTLIHIPPLPPPPLCLSSLAFSLSLGSTTKLQHPKHLAECCWQIHVTSETLHSCGVTTMCFLDMIMHLITHLQ